MPLYRCPVTKQKGYYQLDDAWNDFYEWAEAYFGPYHAFDELDMLPLPCYAIWKVAGEPHSHWDFMAWLKNQYPKSAEEIEAMEKVPKTNASASATLAVQKESKPTSKPKIRKSALEAFAKTEKNGKKKKKPPKPCDRSAAAKKAWETRRKNREKKKKKRSEAAKKAWKTRRAKAGIVVCQWGDDLDE